MDLDHAVLKADLAAAQRALGVTIERIDGERYVDADGRVVRSRTLQVKLPRPTGIRACFVREGLIERVKKLFVHEVEVGCAWFDDHIYVITSTKEATAAWLASQRVQQALILLVDSTRHVQLDNDVLRVVDEEARDDGRDASAELLALVAHLRPTPEAACATRAERPGPSRSRGPDQGAVRARSRKARS